MNTQQIEIVQRTFELAAPMADQIADRFYERLFTMDPSLRALFHGNIQQQGNKLMTMLALVVRSLDRPETILEPARRLGERHVQYGVQPHHYATVGQSLLWTLAQLFGPAFTPEVEDAWTAAYMLLAGVMQETVVIGDS